MKIVLKEEQKKLEVATKETNVMLQSLEVSSADAKKEGDQVCSRVLLALTAHAHGGDLLQSAGYCGRNWSLLAVTLRPKCQPVACALVKMRLTQRVGNLANSRTDLEALRRLACCGSPYYALLGTLIADYSRSLRPAIKCSAVAAESPQTCDHWPHHLLLCTRVNSMGR